MFKEYEFKNIYYFQHINTLGGIESFFYYLSKIIKDLDIVIVYRTGDYDQIQRLKQNVRVIQYHEGMTFKCEKAFFNFNFDIIDTVDAKEYIFVAHGIYTKMESKPNIPDKVTRFIGVTKAAADSLSELTGKKCEVCYNPVDIDKPKKVLHLVSATRLSKDKGGERMQKLATMLDIAQIPYIWDIFTDDQSRIKGDNIFYHEPTLNVAGYFRTADYVVQLSNAEGYCYTMVEALMQGVPVIVTPLDVLEELGVKDGENAIVLDFDMSNVDVNRIYNSTFTFEYKPRTGDWKKQFAPGSSTYQEERKWRYKVRVTEKYAKLHKIDAQLLRFPIAGEEYVVDADRYEYLTNHHRFGTLVDLVDKFKEK